MNILVPVTEEGGLDMRFGKAPRVAVATVDESGAITAWEEHQVGWDVLHDQGEHGQHHARLVRFATEHDATAVVAPHVGPPMINTFNKMGVAVLLVDPSDDARAAVQQAVVAASRQG